MHLPNSRNTRRQDISSVDIDNVGGYAQLCDYCNIHIVYNQSLQFRLSFRLV